VTQETPLSERVRLFALPELEHRPATPRVVASPVDGAGDTVREGHRIARAIVARATAQAREIQAAAEERGLETGMRAALDREGPALRNLAAALADAVTRVEMTRRDLVRRMEATVPDLAVAIAERVIGRELALDPARLADVIRDAMPAVLPAVSIRVRLHPEDLATIERHRTRLEEVSGGAALALEVSPDVGRGGCVIDTESLILPAGVPQQLERALALLKEDR
jgi:flagellar biosynthesis/type III secretory pathway protein FliH